MHCEILRTLYWFDHHSVLAVPSTRIGFPGNSRASGVEKVHSCRVTSLWLRHMHCCVVNFHDGGSVLPGWVLPSASQSYSMALRLRKITACMWEANHSRSKVLFTYAASDKQRGLLHRTVDPYLHCTSSRQTSRLGARHPRKIAGNHHRITHSLRACQDSDISFVNTNKVKFGSCPWKL